MGEEEEEVRKGTSGQKGEREECEEEAKMGGGMKGYGLNSVRRRSSDCF